MCGIKYNFYEMSQDGSLVLSPIDLLYTIKVAANTVHSMREVRNY